MDQHSDNTSTSAPRSKTDFARHYTSLGLPIIPMWFQRLPDGNVKKHVYRHIDIKDATTYPDDFAEFWEKSKTLIQANISGRLVALDFDTHPGKPNGIEACPEWATLSPYAFRTVGKGGRSLFRHESAFRYHDFGN